MARWSTARRAAGFPTAIATARCLLRGLQGYPGQDLAENLLAYFGRLREVVQHGLELFVVHRRPPLSPPQMILMTF